MAHTHLDTDSSTYLENAHAFEGDHLGSAADYREDEFPWPSADAEPIDARQADNQKNGDGDGDGDGDDNDDDDDENDDLPVEDDDLVMPQLPPLPVPSSSAPMDEDEPEEAQAALEHHRQVEESIESLSRRPAVIIRFGGQAGKIVRTPVAGQQDDQFDYATYLSKLDPAAQKNLWYPFTSKLDWEVARWAKLRGPGDTAFTELLAIKGVSETPSFDSRWLT